MVNLKSVTVTHKNGTTALKRVSLRIDDGEFVLINGHSGAGKSTIVRLLTAEDVPTSGEVVIDGVNTKNLTHRQIPKFRRRLGVVFQYFRLIPTMNVFDNIAFAMRAVGRGRKEIKKRVAAVMEIVGLTGKEKSLPTQLSGGQKQRVAIARALASNPKVLLCDEATSALDPATTQSILELLRDINRNLSITVVLITHEMRVIQEICHRVAILAQSQVEEIGEVEEIFLNPKSEAARRLIYPSDRGQESFGAGRRLRLSFDGSKTDAPIVANMVLDCGAPVNILSANTQIIDGKTFGQLVLQLPDNPSAVSRMLLYLRQQGVSYQEENADVHG